MSQNAAELAILYSLQFELQEKVRSGKLSIEAACERERNILNGTYPAKPNYYPPSWWENPVSQIKTMAENRKKAGLTINNIIPQPPKKFKPETPSEVLFLVGSSLPDKSTIKNVQTTFDYCWSLVPIARTEKMRTSDANSNPEHLRIAAGIKDDKPSRWVGFDPESYIGLSTIHAREQAAIDGKILASFEVMMALVSFPKWLRCWDGAKWHYPNMSGYESSYGNNCWIYSPRLSPCLHDNKLGLKLCFYMSDIVDDQRSSPTIRELMY